MIHGLLVVGGNGACPRADGLAGKVEVLTDMPGIDGDHLGGGQAVAPLHAVRNGRPDKRHCRFSRIGLAENGPHDLLRKLLVGSHEQELVLDGKISVKPGQNPFHVIDTEIRFQGVTASGRRHRPGGMPFVQLRPNPLGCPEKEAQLIQGYRLAGIDTPALAVPDGLREIDDGDVMPLAEFCEVDAYRIDHVAAGQAALAAAPRKADELAGQLAAQFQSKQAEIDAFKNQPVERVMERLGERLDGVTIDIQPFANDAAPRRLQVEQVGGAVGGGQ